MATLILASKSLRRRELLVHLGIPFKSKPSNLDEESFAATDPKTLVKRLALEKSLALAQRYPKNAILGADTVVFCRGKILGKPKNKNEALTMLRSLHGQKHRVMTGVAIIVPGKKMIEVVETVVTMRRYSEKEMRSYVQSGKALDKAGAYAIQDKDFNPVKKYAGCGCNVVGLPLWTVAQMLKKMGLNPKISKKTLPAMCGQCPFATR